MNELNAQHDLLSDSAADNSQLIGEDDSNSLLHDSSFDSGKDLSRTISAADNALSVLTVSIEQHQSALSDIDDEIARLDAKLTGMHDCPATRQHLVDSVMATVNELSREWEEDALDCLKEIKACNVVPMLTTNTIDANGRRNLKTSKPLKINPLAASDGIADARAMTSSAPNVRVSMGALLTILKPVLLPALKKWLMNVDLPSESEIPLDRMDQEYRDTLRAHDELIDKRNQIKQRLRAIYGLHNAHGNDGVAPENAVRAAPTMASKMAAASN